MTADYPPTHHMLRDLRFEVDGLDGRGGHAQLPIVAALTDDTGSVRIGAVATLVDLLGGGVAGRAVAPNWMATSDLTVHLVRPIPVAHGGTLHAVGRCLRAGRSTAVVSADLDVDGEIVGIATITFAVLTRRESNPVIEGVAESAALRFAGSEGFDVPMLDAIGVRVVTDDPRALEMEMDPYVQNSLDAVQGGAVAALIEAGAVAALNSALPMRAVQLEVNYLSLVKRGPARTYPRVLLHDDEHAVVEMQVVDHGNNDRLTTAARVVIVPGAAR